MHRRTKETLKTSKSFDDAIGPTRRLSAETGIDVNNKLNGTLNSSKRAFMNTVESDELSSSSSSASPGSNNRRTSERLHIDLGRGLPPKQSKRRQSSLSLQFTKDASSDRLLNHPNEGIINIEDLKERLCNTNKKNLKHKQRRRLSLSSHLSGASGSGERSPIKYLRSPGGDSTGDDNQSLNAGDIFLMGSPPFAPFGDMEESAGGGGGTTKFRDEGHNSTLHRSDYNHNNSTSRETYNMSASSTIPFGNVVKTEREKKRKHQIKTDQMIESIVWFSFHIPRTVLEDLIAHELEFWKRKNDSQRRINRHSAKNSRRQSELVSQNEAADDSEVSVSSLSDEGITPGIKGIGGGASNFTRSFVRREHSGHLSSDSNDLIQLPRAYERESAILFVDMSGFTKLSTLLDVESLSKVINSYFDLIVSEVILYGGDILKFAGDAFFAEWRVADDTDAPSEYEKARNPLSDLNASLVSINEMNFDDSDIPPLSSCVMMASKCATSIVKKFSDYHVTTVDGRSMNEAMLNVHCGVGVGRVVGLHLRNCKEGQDEDAVEMRREFLLLGNPIDQVCSTALSNIPNYRDLSQIFSTFF
jgi:class 3 adenylate cyclase